MKSNINITIDSEVLLEAKARGINMSGTINSFLKDYVQTITKDIKDTKAEEQIKILKASVKVLEKKLEEDKYNGRVIKISTG
jgi:predicted phage tail protein|tara:strand:+ start:223 stop:468 length:246 start_codon:yes stop_codon:yes gene_type:complete